MEHAYKKSGVYVFNDSLLSGSIFRVLAYFDVFDYPLTASEIFEYCDLDLIKFLLQQNLAAITIHLRTVPEMSKVPAHWELMPQILKLRDEISPSTLIIGNGDILNFAEIDTKFKTYNCDGFMVGRGIFQNPWIFNRKIDVEKVTIEQRIDLFTKHINLFNKTWKGDKNPSLLKKFCKTYISNFPDALSLRGKIMACKKTSEMLEVLIEYKISK